MEKELINGSFATKSNLLNLVITKIYECNRLHSGSALEAGKMSIDDEMLYDFELDSLIEKLRGAKRILVQIPDGLKMYFPVIEKQLSSSLGSEVILSINSSFGGCDLDIHEALLLKADALVHFGHSEYSLQEVPYEAEKLKVLFVPVYYKGDIGDELILEAAEKLRAAGAQRPVIGASVQHVRLIPKVYERLSSLGFSPRISSGKRMFSGQIVGCDYTALISAVDSDSALIISGGLFHALGASFAFRGPVIQVDPYAGKVRNMEEERTKWMKRRYAEMMRAREARMWGIIIGTMIGQYRPSILERLKRRIVERGMKYRLFASHILKRENLLNLANYDIDAFVVTSCPRIPIDDFTLDPMEKPVLTPGEALSVIEGKLEVYRFPW